MEETIHIKYTHELCRWVCELRPETLPEKALHETRLRTLDWMGCALGAVGSPAFAKMTHLSDRFGGAEQCTLIGRRKKTSLPNAVFVNAASGHILEFDDVNKISISHPGAAVIPTALAVGELVQANYEQYAAAVTAGYEVVVRLGAVLNPSLYDYWHTTSACGIFAAAVTAGKLLGLDAESMERGMSAAAMMASGLVFGFGTDAKLVNVGHAAAAGALAALLAAEGFSAPEAVLESPGGYSAAVSDSRDYSGLLPKPGEPFMMEESHYKLHASCGHTHSALDACRALLRERPISWTDVESIQVYAYKKAVELVGTFRRDTPAKAKFSLPYCLAAEIIFGNVTLSAFDEAALQDPRIASLAAWIVVLEDPAYTCGYPAVRPERVEIRLKNGEVLSRTCELPEGKCPATAVIREKFINLSGRTIGPSQAEHVCQTILSAARQTEIQALMTELREEIYFGQQHD